METPPSLLPSLSGTMNFSIWRAARHSPLPKMPRGQENWRRVSKN
jgi:hypothetical protein